MQNVKRKAQNTATTVLAIETSCDETGVAIMRREGENIEVLSSALASQVDIHAETGGVVPEVAAREHTQVLRPLTRKVFQEAKIQEPNKTLDAIAVTVGPGLMPALSVGVTAARTLAYTWQKPIVPVHHIEGHIASALLSAEEIRSTKSEIRNKFKIPNSNNVFPALALIVSGGHTMLIEMQNPLQYHVLGETRDDAAGEAFDKVARLLDLPYPGGPHLSKLAEEGDGTAFDFPRPMKNSQDLDFSFSGLKTAVLYTLREQGGTVNKADIAASFQTAVIDSLIAKTKQALRTKKYQTLLLAGGVAANKLLRQELTKLAGTENIPLQIAPFNLCGDNAVMIGMVGLLALEKGRTVGWNEVDAHARISIETFVA